MSSESSLSSVEANRPVLDIVPVHNSFPAVFINDDDPGVITKIDEMVSQYARKPTLRGPVTIEMESPFANSEIRYTLNGENPTPTSLKYSAPLVFRQNATGEKTTMKARIYDRSNSNVKSRIIRLEFRVLLSS